LTSAAVRVRPDGHKARIERGEVVALRRDLTVVGTDKVQFDQPVDRCAVKQAQDFRDDDGCGRGPDEGRADGLAGEQRDAAPVERSALEQPAVPRVGSWQLSILLSSYAPDFRLAVRQQRRSCESPRYRTFIPGTFPAGPWTIDEPLLHVSRPIAGADDHLPRQFTT
jgi:hypothetical protein